MKRYVLSPAARSDLHEMWEFVATDIRAEEGLIESFLERFSLLAAQPLMGQARPDLAGDVRHSRLGTYLISYRPRDDGIEVLRVIHGARDVPRIFRERG